MPNLFLIIKELRVKRLWHFRGALNILQKLHKFTETDVFKETEILNA